AERRILSLHDDLCSAVGPGCDVPDLEGFARLPRAEQEVDGLLHGLTPCARGRSAHRLAAWRAARMAASSGDRLNGAVPASETNPRPWSPRAATSTYVLPCASTTHAPSSPRGN